MSSIAFPDSPDTFLVFGVPLGKLTMNQALGLVHSFLKKSESGHLVNFANVHMVVEARKDPAFHAILRSADLNCPDGKPLSWIGRYRYGDRVTQIAGPDFMPLFCKESVAPGYRHFLYGGAPGVADKAAQKLSELYPGIVIAGTYTPPFQPMTPAEDDELCRHINATGAQVVWVCLGCPKQEKWMYEHRDRLQAKVMFGVGQAFDVLAGTKERAPALFRSAGLEWFYRLVSEPRRLWKRYLVTNFLFIVWITRDAIFSRHA